MSLFQFLQVIPEATSEIAMRDFVRMILDHCLTESKPEQPCKCAQCHPRSFHDEERNGADPAIRKDTSPDGAKVPHMVTRERHQQPSQECTPQERHESSRVISHASSV